MTELLDQKKKKSFVLLKRKSNQIKVNDNHFEQLSMKKGGEKKLDFPGGSDGKESDCSAGDPGSIIRLGRPSGERNGNPLVFLFGEFHGQRSLVGTVHGVTKSSTRLSD